MLISELWMGIVFGNKIWILFNAGTLLFSSSRVIFVTFLSSRSVNQKQT